MSVWFITGVSSGLGLAIAKAALARGDTVHGTVRTEGAAVTFEAVAPSQARAAVLDVTDEAALRAAIAAAGPVDILVNNAGYGLVGAIEETSLAEGRAQFDVNVWACLAAIQAVLPGMRKRRSGHIINITSVSGLAHWAGTGVYCASKFALEAIGRSLADEVRDFGIKVTNVAPGGMRTDYAGRSLVTPAMRLAAYDRGPGHEARGILADHAGREPGLPEAYAAAVVAIAGTDNAPLHLLLGEDALHYSERAITALQADIARSPRLAKA